MIVSNTRTDEVVLILFFILVKQNLKTKFAIIFLFSIIKTLIY